MRARIGGHEVEGTPAELAELLAALSQSAAADNKKAHPGVGKGDASPFVTEEAAALVLSRRPLGNTHAKLLKLLYKANEAWTTAPQLQKSLDLTTREFAGALGALGRRVSHTAGVGSRSFLDQYWDAEHGYNLYRLPPSVRAALVKADLA